MFEKRDRAGPRLARYATRVAVLAAILASGFSVAHAAITAELTFTPDLISSADVSTLTVVLANTDTAAATALNGSAALPAGLVVAPWPNLTNSCGGAISLTPGGTTVAIADGTIPAATASGPGSCSISFDVVPDSQGTFEATLPVGSLTTSLGNLSQAAIATLGAGGNRPILGKKDFSPDRVHGNPNSQAGQSTVTITLENRNAFALTGMSFTDVLPDGLLLAQPPNASTTCGGSLNNPQPGSPSISLTNGTIAAGGSCTVTFEVFIDADTANTFNENKVLHNQVHANDITTNESVTNATFNANLKIQSGAEVIKTFYPTAIFSGGSATLTLEFRNYNASPLTSINLTDNLPSPMVVANPADSFTSCPAGTVNASPGNASFSFTNGQVPAAPSGQGYTSCTVSVSVTATSAAAITLTNTTDAGEFGGVNVDPASADLTINPGASIQALKSFAGTAVQTGVVTLTIVLHNQAPTPAGNASITGDLLTTMGAGYTVAASPASQTTCLGTLSAPPGGTTVTLSNGTIPAGGTCTVTVPVQISGTADLGTRTNTIPAGAIQTSLGNTTTATTASITTVPALGLSKAFAPTTVVAGQDARLAVTITHADQAAPFTNLSFTDTLPPGHLVSATPAVTNTCGGAVTAAPGAGTFELTGGALGAGLTSCTVEVNVTTPTTAGSATNTLPAGAVTTAEGATNGSAASATLVRIQTAVLLSKSFAPDAIAPGDTSTLTVTIANTDVNALSLTGGTLVDTQPLGLVIADPANAAFPGTGCTGTVTATPGGSIVTLSGASIPAGGVCTVQVDVTTTTAGSFTDLVPPGAFRSTQGVTNATAAEAILTATGSADLAVTKSSDVASVTPGATVTFVITVSNPGPDDVAGAVVADNAPPGTQFAAWTCTPSAGAKCTAAGSGNVLDTVTIPAGGSLKYFATTAVPPALTGSITNTATITPPPDVNDPDSDNNTASLTLPLSPVTSLPVAKGDGSAFYTPGAPQTYIVNVGNAGPSDAADVEISDPLPPGMTLAGVPTCLASGQAICGIVSGAAGGTAVGLTGGRIPAGPGNGLNLTVPVIYAPNLAADPLVNTATATDDPSGGSGFASDSDTRQPIVALAVVVDDASATYTPGGTGTVTVTVTNANGISDALAVSVGNLLPPGVTLTGTVTCVANSGATCGAVSGAAGGTTFGMTGAVLGAGAGNSLVLVLPVAFAANLTTNPLVFTATATDGASGNSATGSDGVTPVLNVALTVSKTAGTDVYHPGGKGTYTLVVGNTGLSDALAVSVADTLPAGVILSGNVTCTRTGNASCGTVTGTPGGSAFGTSGAQVGGGPGNTLTLVAPVAFAVDLIADPLVNTVTVSDPASGSVETASASSSRGAPVAIPIGSPQGLVLLVVFFLLSGIARARHQRQTRT